MSRVAIIRERLRDAAVNWTKDVFVLSKTRKRYCTDSGTGSLNRLKCAIWMSSMCQKKDGLPNIIKEMRK
jgi:hypothetical protein